MLIAQGLYQDEAQAMLETWRDSWFEEGSRLLYIVPRGIRGPRLAALDQPRSGTNRARLRWPHGIGDARHATRCRASSGHARPHDSRTL